MNTATPFDPFQLRFKLRPDLEWSLYSEESPPTWVARDPISMEYFYFSDLEKQLLIGLDGNCSLADVLKHPMATSVTEQFLLELVLKLEAAHLILRVEGPPNGQFLWRAQQRKRGLSRFQWLLAPLSIRFKLFDPSPILNRLSPLSSFLFSRPLLYLFIAIVPIVGYLVILELLQIGRMSYFFQYVEQLSSQRVFSILLIFIILKSLHELGHALACKKWQVECHDVGVMFLVFTPCLYCNTSDSWKLTNRWRRAAIAAAGIYVELMVATAAGILWLMTRPDSWLNWAAAYTMAIGSVSTILVNANPLLRYDGYYILSDLWRVPNLSEQGREALRSILKYLLTDRPVPKDRWDAHPLWLAGYSIAAMIYRIILLSVILFVVWSMLDRLGLRLVGLALVAVTLSTILYATALGIRSFIREIIADGPVHGTKLWGTAALLGLLIWLVFGLPLPSTVSARGTAKFSQRSPIYANQTGRLVSFTPPGQLVMAGDELVRLQSFELERELLDIQGRLELLEDYLNYLKLALVDDEQAALELGDVIEQIGMYRARSSILKSELESLVVVAPHSGRFMASDFPIDTTLAEEDHQPAWRALLDSAHLDCTIERGTLMGWLSANGKFELSVFVCESDTERISPDMHVVCRWDCHPATVYRGKVRRIIPKPIEATPPVLIGDADFISRINSHGISVPDIPHYEILIDMDDYPESLTQNSLASVHIRTAPQTLWQRLYRFLLLNIRPELVGR